MPQYILEIGTFIRLLVAMKILNIPFLNIVLLLGQGLVSV